MNELELVEGGRRARAAMAYAGHEKRAFVKLVPFSESTINRIFAGTRRTTSYDDLAKIADACAVPRDWFTADPLRFSEITLPGLPKYGPTNELEARMTRALEEAVRQAGQQGATGAKGKRASAPKGPRR